MDASLVLVMPDGKQTEIPIRRAVQVIGRQTDCQIRIPSGSVSRHHCEIAVTDGGLSVRDLGSSNGTFVNKRRVTQTDLSAGDLIAVGDLVFVVRLDGRPSAINSEDVIEDGQVKVPQASASARAASSAKSGPAKKPALAEADDNEGSSVDEFDFLDDDDDIKKQPKL
ncbi:ABC transporter ATP-binding/permease protein [Phycisphaerales bacterium]|nr:ABC transporter ATP-binding/permease protein [Phycisphaerales bacterium]